jgi:hypothetical protein
MVIAGTRMMAAATCGMVNPAAAAQAAFGSNISQQDG